MICKFLISTVRNLTVGFTHSSES